MHYIVATRFNLMRDAIMKTTRLILIGLVWGAGSLCEISLCQDQTTPGARSSEPSVLEMKSVPDGHFLATLQWDGRERRVNFEVNDNAAKCVNSDENRLKGLSGKFQAIGNGVFLIFIQNENHRASQFWVFHKDGSAAVKEIPDRGEKQLAIRVKGDSLEVPKKD